MESCPDNTQRGKLSWILAPHGQGQNDGKKKTKNWPHEDNKEPLAVV